MRAKSWGEVAVMKTKVTHCHDCGVSLEKNKRGSKCHKCFKVYINKYRKNMGYSDPWKDEESIRMAWL